MSDLHDAIERAIKEHCAGGDLWLCANIASKPFDTRIAELERECSQWRDELRIYRETENKRIAELEQSVTVRDTEIARLETDLELARRDAERYWWLRDKWYLNKREQRCLDECLSLNPWADPPPEDFDNAIDAARAGNGGGA